MQSKRWKAEKQTAPEESMYESSIEQMESCVFLAANVNVDGKTRSSLFSITDVEVVVRIQISQVIPDDCRNTMSTFDL